MGPTPQAPAVSPTVGGCPLAFQVYAGNVQTTSLLDPSCHRIEAPAKTAGPCLMLPPSGGVQTTDQGGIARGPPMQRYGALLRM